MSAGKKFIIQTDTYRYYLILHYSDQTAIIINRITRQNVAYWQPVLNQWLTHPDRNPFDNPDDNAILELMRITSNWKGSGS